MLLFRPAVQSQLMKTRLFPHWPPWPEKMAGPEMKTNIQAQREGRTAPAPGPRPRPRKSMVDPFEPILQELLAKYPNLTVERAWQELQARGYAGGYTVVRERVSGRSTFFCSACQV